VGCIPSKALLDSSWKFKEAQDGFAIHGISRRRDHGRASDENGRPQGNIVKGLTSGVATCSKPTA
jgi:dihydrolipoamide dehydrogenase